VVPVEELLLLLLCCGVRERANATVERRRRVVVGFGDQGRVGGPPGHAASTAYGHAAGGLCRGRWCGPGRLREQAKTEAATR
jgi:hypothetical protein